MILRNTAKYNKTLKRQISSISLKAFLDLDCKLPCRCENQGLNFPRLHSVCWMLESVLLHQLQNRDSECGCFSCSCLSATQQVSFLQYNRNGVLLNRGRLGIAFMGQSFEHGLNEL